MNIYDGNGNQVTTTNYFSVENKRKDPAYFGHDYEHNVFGKNVNLPMSKYPCKTFTDANITAIVKNLNGISIGNYVKVLGQNCSFTNEGTVLAGNDVYTLFRTDISIDTSLTPATASDQTWEFVLYLYGSGTNVSSNDDVVIVADMPLEDITEDFINSNYTYMTVSSEFVAAVDYALSPSVHPHEQLQGKLWLAIGDSYTYQMAGVLSGNVVAENSLLGQMASTLGMTCYSYGVNSSTIRTSSDNWGQDQGAHQPMVTRVDSIVTTHSSNASDVALITFMGGINDPETESKVGTFLSTGKDTTCGGCHYIFKTLLQNFPNAKIIVILQPSCYNFTNPGTGDTAGFDDYQYGDYQCGKKQRYVKEIAEMYGLDICDCIFNWYTPQNPLHRERYWSTDKIHLNNTGFRRLSEKLALKINEVFG